MATPTLGTPAAQSLDMGSDGRIAGIEGVLNQIVEAVARQAGPMIREQVLPAIQQDKALQQTIGTSMGNAIAARLRLPVWIAALSLAAIGGVMVHNAYKSR